MDALDVLRRAWAVSGSALCIGLDPDPRRMPSAFDGSTPDDLYRFCVEIVDATAEMACAFKPQIAYFAALGAEPVLERICAHIREEHPDHFLVLDAKRGDIGPTAEQYAREAFVRYGAHMVTVNPYLGTDSVLPYFAHENHGVFVLCRTSNRGGDDFQSLLVAGEPLYRHVARKVATEWSRHGPCGLIVGATYPSELADVRAVAPRLPLLIPGVGAQGGDIAATVDAGRDADGLGMVVNSSRAILYASTGADFAEAARSEAGRTRDAINRSAIRR
jgi:orotidine-5'-phosphate decarboxylase